MDSKGLQKAAKCDEVYYAHPFRSWERGSNENGKCILRRFLPKGTDFSTLKPRDLKRGEDWVNNEEVKKFLPTCHLLQYACVIGSFIIKKIDRADSLAEGHVRLEEKGMKLYETYGKSAGIGLYVDAGDVEHEFRHVDRYC